MRTGNNSQMGFLPYLNEIPYSLIPIDSSIKSMLVNGLRCSKSEPEVVFLNFKLFVLAVEISAFSLVQLSNAGLR